MSSIEIGKRIKEIRTSAGLNQRDFAEILSTSSGYISGVESGKNMAGSDFLLRLHEKFNTNLHYLLTGIDLNLEQSAAVTAQNPIDLTKEEREILNCYRKSNELGQAVILCAARGTEKIIDIKNDWQVPETSAERFAEYQRICNVENLSEKPARWVKLYPSSNEYRMMSKKQVG